MGEADDGGVSPVLVWRVGRRPLARACRPQAGEIGAPLAKFTQCMCIDTVYGANVRLDTMCSHPTPRTAQPRYAQPRLPVPVGR